MCVNLYATPSVWYDFLNNGIVVQRLRCLKSYLFSNSHSYEGHSVWSRNNVFMLWVIFVCTFWSNQLAYLSWGVLQAPVIEMHQRFSQQYALKTERLLVCPVAKWRGCMALQSLFESVRELHNWTHPIFNSQVKCTGCIATYIALRMDRIGCITNMH